MDQELIEKLLNNTNYDNISFQLDDSIEVISNDIVSDSDDDFNFDWVKEGDYFTLSITVDNIREKLYHRTLEGLFDLYQSRLK